MTIPQADGMTEATLHGPALPSTLQTAALRGPACAASKRKRRKKLNTRRRPKNVNMTRRRAPRTNLKSPSYQRVKDQVLQEGDLSPECPVLHLVPLRVSGIRHLREDDRPRCLTETPDLTLDPTHPVDLDLEGGPGLIQDPGACLGLEVGPGLEPDLSPILEPGLDPGQGPDPGTDPGLCLHLERGVYPHLQESEKQASPNRTP